MQTTMRSMRYSDSSIDVVEVARCGGRATRQELERFLISWKIPFMLVSISQATSFPF